MLTGDYSTEAADSITRLLIAASPRLDRLSPELLNNKDIIGIVDPQLRVLRFRSQHYRLRLGQDMWRTLELFFEGTNYKVDTNAMIASGHFTNRSNVYNHMSRVSFALGEVGLTELGVDVVQENSDPGIYELVFPGKRYLLSADFR